jgi:deoxyuridine 5'-triphosphate nucleotidohydrolase
MDGYLKIKRIHDNAITPHRLSAKSPGFMLASVEDVVIPPLHWKQVPIGISLEIPEGTYGRIAPLPVLTQQQVLTSPCIVDDDLSKELKVMLVNLCTNKVLRLSKGQRVAQLIIEKVALPVVVVA